MDYARRAARGRIGRTDDTPARPPLRKNTSMSHPDFDPEYVFAHHHATPEQLAHYDAIHEGAKTLRGGGSSLTPRGRTIR